MRELPLNGRNFLQLTLLQPGVSATDGPQHREQGPAGGSDISVSGGSTTSNLWLIDGADNVDHGSNRTILVYPSVDAIEEFKIQRNNYGAEFGQAGGAQVNLVTRGGTNAVPRQRVLLRPPRLPERERTTSWSRPARTSPRSSGTTSAATFGGPVIKDKLHFFVSYEKNKDRRGPASAAGSFPRRPSGTATSASPAWPAARRRSRSTPSRASRSRAT